jgi:hypothetical protein
LLCFFASVVAGNGLVQLSELLPSATNCSKASSLSEFSVFAVCGLFLPELRDPSTIGTRPLTGSLILAPGDEESETSIA